MLNCEMNKAAAEIAFNFNSEDLQRLVIHEKFDPCMNEVDTITLIKGLSRLEWEVTCRFNGAWCYVEAMHRSGRRSSEIGQVFTRTATIAVLRAAGKLD